MPNMLPSKKNTTIRSMITSDTVTTRTDAMGSFTEPSICTKGVIEELMIMGSAPNRNPRRYCTEWPVSSPSAPRSAASCGANARPRPVVTRPITEPTRTMTEKTFRTSSRSPRPRAREARMFPPVLPTMPRAAKRKPIGEMIPMVPSLLTPRNCPTMILSMSGPSTTVNAVRTAVARKERYVLRIR